jgi:hypothetical protein
MSGNVLNQTCLGYPKKAEVAPRMTPLMPNCAGMNGDRLSELKAVKPTVIMKMHSTTCNANGLVNE